MGALLPDVFCVVRYLEGATDLSVLLINRSELPLDVTLDPAMLDEGPDAAVPVPLTGMLTDVLTGDTTACTGETLHARVPPLTARLYTR